MCRPGSYQQTSKNDVWERDWCGIPKDNLLLSNRQRDYLISSQSRRITGDACRLRHHRRNRCGYCYLYLALLQQRTLESGLGTTSNPQNFVPYPYRTSWRVTLRWRHMYHQLCGLRPWMLKQHHRRRTKNRISGCISIQISPGYILNYAVWWSNFIVWISTGSTPTSLWPTILAFFMSAQFKPLKFVFLQSRKVF